MHAEFTVQLEEQLQVIKEQSDQVIELRTNEIKLQQELKETNLRDQVLEEMRSEREVKMKKSLKDKIEKRLIEDMSKEIRASLEADIRKELTEKITDELKVKNEKELH